MPSPSHRGPEEEDSERRPLLDATASESYAGPDGTSNPGSKAHDVQVSYPLLKFSIAWLGVFLANADLGLVLATYSSIASDLRDLYNGAWLLTGYQLGYSVALPAYGAVSERYGRKIPLLLAYAFFGIGSLLSGIGTNLLTVTIGRLIQGIGGAGTTSVVTIIIRDLVPVSHAVVLLSYLNIAAIVGRGAGGPIGGLLYDNIGWRWSLIGQVPIALICFAGAATQTLPSDNTATSDDVEPKTKRRLDIPGLIAFAIAMTSFLLATDYAGQGVHITNPIVLVPLIIFIVSIIALAYIEIRISSNPMLAPALFKQKGVTPMYLVQALLMSAQFSALSSLPTYFIRTRNASNTLASLVLLPAPLGNALGSYAAGKFIERTKQYLPPLYLTSLLSPTAFIIMLIRWSPIPLPWNTNATTADIPISPWECLILAPPAFSMGMVVAAGFAGVNASVSEEQVAIAISVLYLSQQIGLIVGTAGGTGLARVGFARSLKDQLGSMDGSEKIIEKTLKHTRWAWKHASPAMQTLVANSYAMGYTFVSIFAVVCVCLAVPMIVMLPKRKVE